MACKDNQTLGPFTVWTQKSATYLFHPASAPESTVNWRDVRGSIENRGSSGAISTRIVYRLSNDGITWDSPLALYRSPNNPQVQTNDGTAYGSTFVDLSGDIQGKQWIQWGVEAANSSGTSTELATVTVKLDRV